jgi:hypothetical protein
LFTPDRSVAFKQNFIGKLKEMYRYGCDIPIPAFPLFAKKSKKGDIFTPGVWRSGEAFRLRDPRVSACGRAAVVLYLPAIMQWVKQTFSLRFNLYAGKTGHVWGGQYWSRIVEGEPPEWAGEVDWTAVDVAADAGEISFGTCPPDEVSPLMAEKPAETGFSPQNSTRSPPPPG